MNMEYTHTLILMTVALGLYMAWGIGANDLANSMGPATGSGAISLTEAIILAAIFEFAGAMLYGAQVTETIRHEIIDFTFIEKEPKVLACGMLASLSAAAVWLTIAAVKGWPVSTTHSIIGAMLGFALVAIGIDSVHWGHIRNITASWVVSPLLGGLLSFLLMKSILALILDTQDPLKNARRWTPFFIFLAGFVVALATLLRGMEGFGIELSTKQSFLLSAAVGAGIAFVGMSSIKNLRAKNVDHVFFPMMIFTACAMAFAHGSNDVANAVGPMTIAFNIFDNNSAFAQELVMPTWILLAGGGGIVLGLTTFGFRVLRTVGRQITELSSCRAFAATLASAATVVLASNFGLPVSTTHIVVGAVIGVGVANTIHAVNFRLVGKIVISWLITLPITAILTAIFFFGFKRFI